MSRVTHIFFDFFGTLVSYTDSRTEQGYPETYTILQEAGATVSYAGFLDVWERIFGGFETQAAQSLDEFSMDEVCAAFLGEILPASPTPTILSNFRDVYLAEWSKGIVYIPGLPGMLEKLAARYTLGLISNTHHPPLVHRQLAAAQLERFFPTLVTSVEFGKRKPAPEIFHHALALCDAKPETSLYVGDSYSADYLGALGAGLRALLIDPDGKYNIPPEERLSHLLELTQHKSI